jgi:hypothetical protein
LRFSGEPVAAIVHEYTDDANVIVAAMMRDGLEDTDVTAVELRRGFGNAIADLMLEVTDVSRPSDGKRAIWEEKDKEHLDKSSASGAIIKLTDLIDKCVGIADNDEGFAPAYLREAEELLPVLKRGDQRFVGAGAGYVESSQDKTTSGKMTRYAL